MVYTQPDDRENKHGSEAVQAIDVQLYVIFSLFSFLFVPTL